MDTSNVLKWVAMTPRSLLKTCTKCGVEKPLTEFSKTPKGEFGVKSRCKACVNEYSRQRQKRKRDANIKVDATRSGIGVNAPSGAWFEVPSFSRNPEDTYLYVLGYVNPDPPANGTDPYILNMRVIKTRLLLRIRKRLIRSRCNQGIVNLTVVGKTMARESNIKSTGMLKKALVQIVTHDDVISASMEPSDLGGAQSHLLYSITDPHRLMDYIEQNIDIPCANVAAQV